MRMFLGMVLGAMLTVTAAFVSDSATQATGSQPLVNWSVAGEKLQDLAAIANARLSDLLGG